MSKQTVDSIVTRLFLAFLVLDAVTVIYLTPKQVHTPPPESQTTPTTTPPTNSNSEEEIIDSTINTETPFEDADDDIFRQEKTNGDTISGTLVISYCTSHQSHLDTIKTYLSGVYPAVTIETTQYPLPPVKALLSKFCSYIHWVMLALNLFGDKIFGFLNMPYPQWYLLMKEKKIVVMLVVIGGSMALSGLVNKTDAFDVYFDGELAFSKFQKGVLPTTQNFDDILLR